MRRPISFETAMAEGHDRFTPVRLALALAVVVSHAFSVGAGSTAGEPLMASTGYTLGEHAVNMFFAISGFLVTMSYVRRGPGDYTVARTLRIAPGLVGVVLVTAFILGPLATALPLTDYFRRGETWTFVVSTLTTLKSTARLPGLFEGNPFKFVLGTVWTLKYEIFCYLGVLLFGLLGLLRRPALVLAFLVALIVARLGLDLVGTSGHGALPTGIRLFLCFSAGAAIYLYRDKVPASLPLAVLLLALTAVLLGTPVAPTLMFLVESYAVLALAMAPMTALASFESPWKPPSWDLSYGVYLYGWPVQQMLQSRCPDWGVGVALPVAMVITLAVAALSWLLIEKPALGIKARLLGAPKNKKLPAY